MATSGRHRTPLSSLGYMVSGPTPGSTWSCPRADKERGGGGVSYYFDVTKLNVQLESICMYIEQTNVNT